MKKNICCVLSSLILISVMYICLYVPADSVILSVDNNIKYVDSEVLLATNVEIVDENNVINQKKDNFDDNVIEESIDILEENITSSSNNIIEENNNTLVDEEESNEILIGTMSGYGPDCYGCSGYLAYGMYVGDGTIYYNDNEYGKVRIVAGDKKYSFGTIIKINDDMLAIVLDRGGNIGIDKKFLFDLLYTSEEEAYEYGILKNSKFEILRNGF